MLWRPCRLRDGVRPPPSDDASRHGGRFLHRDKRRLVGLDHVELVGAVERVHRVEHLEWIDDVEFVHFVRRIHDVQFVHFVERLYDVERVELFGCSGQLFFCRSRTYVHAARG
jgi:hypothetical protein